MSERILVLGASGFIGRHLVEQLASEGTRVTATYRTSAPEVPPPATVRWRAVDVLEPRTLGRVVEGHDTVYHLAGAGLQAADPATVRRVNAVGTRHVVDACRAAEVDRLLFASTAGTRRADGPATEADLARPIGPYQESKLAAERIIDAAAGGDMEAVTVHPTAVIGPRDVHLTERLLRLATTPYMLAHPPGGASFVGVGDVIDGMIAAMRHGRDGDHYLLGGENLTYGAALQRIVAAIDGYPVPFAVPAPVIHAAGPIAAVLSRVTGRRLFPFSGAMARLATREHFYHSGKAASELGYDVDPLESTIRPAMAWYTDDSLVSERAPPEEPPIARARA